VSIPPEVRSLVVCPVCGGELEDDGGGLLCPACQKVYPVLEGVPVLLPARARKFLRGRRGDGSPPRR
jgi:uncharacterized protein YbaR (Trm112 family)